MGALIFFFVYLFLSDIFSYNMTINTLMTTNLTPYGWMILSFLILLFTALTLASGGMGAFLHQA